MDTKTQWDTILVTKDGPVLEVVLNRPEARNAFTWRMHEELETEVIDFAEDDPDVRVVTVRGAGPIFSAGHDLKEVAEGYSTTGEASGVPKLRPWLKRIWYFNKPIVAAVHGYVGPIAMDFLSHCDFVIAAEGTRFSFEQARMGGGSPGGTPLVFHFPIRVWKKLLMVGGWFDAEQALKWDFVQRVVPPDQLEDELKRWALEIAKVPAKQVEAAKSGIHRQYELMGLVNMEGVQNRESGHGSPEDMEFFRIVMEKGLREALKLRDDDFDQDISRI